MAYYRLEPFGEQVADWRHGVATSLLANVNRDATARSEPYKPDDFVFWRNGKPTEDTKPVLLADATAQSNLLRAALFGKTTKH